jgi:7-cyano-7-deazaguanine synthase in queuosine biosynthesis
MPDQPQSYNIFCGENVTRANPEKDYQLSYYDVGDFKANVAVKFAQFHPNITELQPKILDLLDIAVYVFSSDRSILRGARDSLHNKKWARTLNFYIPVRDMDFWNDSKLTASLSEALGFMSGDRKYNFFFEKYKKRASMDHEPTLFTDDIIPLDARDDIDIMLFSGGLDSLAGAVEMLNSTKKKKLYLVAHKSNHNVIKTQNGLIEALSKKYDGRIKYYGFECHFTGTSRIEETQRTRMFLFSAIAFAICSFYSKKEFFVFENGITSINLPKQTDVINVRASRTTHPRTMGLLEKFYNAFVKGYKFITPYFYKTKSDIMDIFMQFKEENLIASSVSCSTSRNNDRSSHHCGVCSQCIDRRFAIYATGLEDYSDNYVKDIISGNNDAETLTRLYNTLRFASMQDFPTQTAFFTKFTNEIDDLLDYMPGDNPDDKVSDLYSFYCRYADSILIAASKMQQKFSDLRSPVPSNSLLQILASREYLKTPFQTRVEEIDIFLKDKIRIMFQRVKPVNENDFNDKIETLLLGLGPFNREFPPLKFGITKYIPDHSQDELLIESKYLRKSTTKSVASQGIAADITEVIRNSKTCGMFFIVYDPEIKIKNDTDFINSFQDDPRGNCFVRIYR